MKQTYILDKEHLDTIANDIVKSFTNGVIILEGDLAAGKTTLVQAIAQALKSDDEVTSPTFSLQQCYANGLYHYDIYNHGIEHFIALGMLEELEKDGLHCIEWGDETLKNLLQNVGIEYIHITIKKLPNNKREYTLCTH